MKGCALEAVSALSHKKNKGGFERMKKNLKKVISAVLALTLAMSSFVAMTTSAATFADVADTANYAEAVNALAAIGAIAGYEDGTFLPDNNITRAEVTTMVVAAVNMTADAQASGATTKFADVNEKAKWAAGYVNVGVANGWISGMSATEFAPSDNVTYAQVLSMLTRILGYGDYAVSKGGWPDGYLAAAASAGILSGVSAAANDAMTRAQVAQLIWNAIQAPKLDITTFGVTASDSLMQKLDGKNGREFRTVLSDRFDAYIFNNVIVDDIAATGNGLEAGTVDISLTSTADYNPAELRFAVATDDLDKVEVGATAAEDYLFSSAKIVASYIDDEWKLLYFKPTAKVSTTTVDGDLAASVTASELQVSKSAVTTAVNKYKLTAGATDLYVNGKLFITLDGTNNAQALAVLKAAVGDVVLYENTTATGKEYNKIMVNAYALAKVTQVADRADQVTVRVVAPNWPGALGFVNAGTSFSVTDDEIADGDKVVTVTKNGAAADLSALAADDIIAIKYDITTTANLSSSLEILATTDKVTGVYTYYDDVEDLYEVGGAMYEAATALNSDPSFVRGTTYTLALDPFGRLYSYEEEASSKNYAIVEKYVTTAAVGSSSEYDYMDVVTLDGQSKRLYVDNTTAATTNVAAAITAVKGSAAGSTENFKGTAPAGRVIEYSVKTSTGRVNAASKVTTTAVSGKYKAETNKLDKNLAANVTVLDASTYVANAGAASVADYKASSLDALSSSVTYSGFVLHQNSANEYTYLVLTLAGAKYGPSSDFAVAAAAASTASGSIVDDEDVYTLRVMKDGANEAEVLNISTSVQVYVNGSAGSYGAGSIPKGSAFFYTTDSYGLVDRIDVILVGQATFDAYRDTALATLVKAPAGTNVVSTADHGWAVDVDENNATGVEEKVQLFIAPVLRATDRTVTFALMGGGNTYVDASTEYDYAIAADANIYYYDMNVNAPTNYTAFSGGAFTGLNGKLTADDKAYIASVPAGEIDFDGSLQVAFVMVVDGVVTNALVIGE